MCRELTKRFEEVVRGPVEQIAGRFAEAPKGEITLVLGAGEGSLDASAVAEAQQAVSDLIAGGAPRKLAVEVIARLTGVPRNALYRSSL